MRRPFLLTVGALLLGFAACSGTTTNTTTIISTGIIVRSDALFASKGCGEGDSQVFKYVAVLSKSVDGGPAQSFTGEYDCFADAFFTPPSANGETYAIQIFAFSKQALNKGKVDVNKLGCESATPHTYETSCEAVQQQDVQVLADCRPLRSACVAPATPDAGSSDAGDAGSSDASDSAASDGGDASAVSDAGDTGDTG